MKHWTEDDLRNWLYGLKEEDPHVLECGKCREEMGRLTAVRRKLVAMPEVPADLLAAQRRNIYGRLDENPRNWIAVRWAVSAAMLTMLVFGGLTYERRHEQVPQPVSDEQLFSDLSRMEQSAEPQAIQPIHGLFQE